MPLNFEIYQPENPLHEQAVADVSDWSERSGSMLPLYKERIANFPLSVFGFKKVETASHAAVTKIEEGVAHIGGYVVNPGLREQGIGISTLWEIMRFAAVMPEDFDELEAYVNKSGISQFGTLGWSVEGKRVPMPPTGCDQILKISREAVLELGSTPQQMAL